MTLKIANSYGNIDVRQSLPKRYVHVRGERLQPICRKLGIQFAKALVGFEGKKRYGYSPTFNGVVVSAQSAPRLLKAIEERQAKATDPKTLAAKERAKERAEERQKQDEERKKQREAAFCDRCRELEINPYSRTADWLRRGLITEEAAELIAFKTEYRHCHTNYDDHFVDGDYESLREMGYSPAEAREDMVQAARSSMSEDPIPATWDKYLKTYGFDSDVAKALAETLKDPKKCHPTWFKKAEIAVRRAGLPLDSITYDLIKLAIRVLDFCGPRFDDY